MEIDRCDIAIGEYQRVAMLFENREHVCEGAQKQDTIVNIGNSAALFVLNSETR